MNVQDLKCDIIYGIVCEKIYCHLAARRSMLYPQELILRLYIHSKDFQFYKKQKGINTFDNNKWLNLDYRIDVINSTTDIERYFNSENL